MQHFTLFGWHLAASVHIAANFTVASIWKTKFWTCTIWLQQYFCNRFRRFSRLRHCVFNPYTPLSLVERFSPCFVSFDEGVPIGVERRNV